MALMAIMAPMTVLKKMASTSLSFTILHILVIGTVMDMVIMTAISITVVMATLAIMDAKVRMTSHAVRAKIL